MNLLADKFTGLMRRISAYASSPSVSAFVSREVLDDFGIAEDLTLHHGTFHRFLSVRFFRFHQASEMARNKRDGIYHSFVLVRFVFMVQLLEGVFARLLESNEKFVRCFVRLAYFAGQEQPAHVLVQFGRRQMRGGAIAFLIAFHKLLSGSFGQASRFFVNRFASGGRFGDNRTSAAILASQ
jgi:hypothetical protein